MINSIIIPSGEISIQLNKDTTNQCKKQDVIKDSLCNILKIKFYFLYSELIGPLFKQNSVLVVSTLLLWAFLCSFKFHALVKNV